MMLLAFPQLCFSQKFTERYEHLGKMYIAALTSAPFPHADRAMGHTYNNQTYSKEKHYNDSSVAIFIPNGFQETEKINLVVYFHGWNNNIDSACTQFKLIEQFSNSKKNAIFVFPEGPKNAPDSHAGKLKDTDGLKHLLDDVLRYLSDAGELNTIHIGDVILAGHSGAYNVISFCLEHGGLIQKISDVILFDALYANVAKYLHWIDNFTGRFINIYTDNGGTKNESENLMARFDSSGTKYFLIEEEKLVQNNLIENRLIFIHTDLSHNEVISQRKQFQSYLMSSKMESIHK